MHVCAHAEAGKKDTIFQVKHQWLSGLKALLVQLIL